MFLLALSLRASSYMEARRSGRGTQLLFHQLFERLFAEPLFLLAPLLLFLGERLIAGSLLIVMLEERDATFLLNGILGYQDKSVYIDRALQRFHPLGLESLSLLE